MRRTPWKCQGSWAALSCVALAVGLSACGSDERPEPPDATVAPGEYRAEVRWTSFGVPHLRAADLASITYATAYVMNRDAVCELAEEYVRLRSQRARYFGAGEGDANLSSDLAMLAAGVRATALRTYPELDSETRQQLVAYAAGYNRYLDETDASALPEPCRGARWVMPIEPEDVWMYWHYLGLLGSTDVLQSYLPRAAPPASSAASLRRVLRRHKTRASDARIAQLRRVALRSELGSNGWAIGEERSETGRGMLLANPHFPWQGPRRMYERQITIPGKLDLYGVGLIGTAAIVIGVNQQLAWTHTVDTAKHFTIYRLTLVPGKPTHYMFDGNERELTATEHSVQVLQPDGSIALVKRTLYRSHYGPMLAIPGLDWTETTAYSYRDANEGNLDLLRTVNAMNRATTLQELEAAQVDLHGLAWLNTMAISAEGQALYFDASRTPALSEGAEQAFREALRSDPITRAMYDGGAVLLDGSSSAFDWQASDPRLPGLVAYRDSPRLERRDFVMNANDSHWLINPAAPLTGYSILFGDEGAPVSPRTRMNLRMLTETGAGSPAGVDGKFSLDELARVPFLNRASLGELLADAVVARCRAVPKADVDGKSVDLTPACDALAAWDRRVDLDSPGAPLWREFLANFSGFRTSGDLFGDAFDPADPVATPRTLKAAANGNDSVLEALARALVRLQEVGGSARSTLGDLQFTLRGSERVSIHGGNAAEGAFNIVSYSTSVGARVLDPRQAPTLSKFGLTANGYPINFGTSFMLAVELGEAGPVGRVLLSYSQSPDPMSPHHADQTRLFSRKEWRPLQLREEDIAADPELRQEEIRGRRVEECESARAARPGLGLR